LIFSAGAAETVIVLSLLISLYNFNRSINIHSLNNLT
jgi:NADH:ubiquinone oxidoreductase subunit K